MAAARQDRVLKGAAKALLAAVSALPDRQALERLTQWQAGEGPGLRRRALLAARIVLMRRLLAEPRPVVVAVAPALPEPAPEVVVPPVVEAVVEVVAAPAPRPARPAKTKMTTFSLEDAAKLLMTSAADDPEESEAGMAAAAPGGEPVLDGGETPEAAFRPAGWTHMAAAVDAPLDGADEVLWQADAAAGFVEVTDVEVAQGRLEQMDDLAEGAEAQDAAEPEAVQDNMPVPETPLPPYRKSRSTKVLQMDIGAQFAAMADDGGPALAAEQVPAALPATLDASLAALDGLEDLAQGAPGRDTPKRAAAKPGKGKPVAVGNMGAQFAALEALQEAEVAALGQAPAKPAQTIDLAAQFAALQDPDA
jgi:hypothetical protein